MGQMKDLMNKIKLILSDLRRHLGLLVIITLIWIMLLAGIVFLNVYIGKYFEPHPDFRSFMLGLGFSDAFVNLLTQIVQVGIGAVYILIWLYLWHRLVRMYFWRTVVKYNPSSEDNSEKKE